MFSEQDFVCICVCVHACYEMLLRPQACSCEPSGSIKCGEFFDKLSDLDFQGLCSLVSWLVSCTTHPVVFGYSVLSMLLGWEK
jgi:hypothetical protein